MTWVRLFSLADAQAVLPEVKAAMARAQAAWDAGREAREHLADLSALWGDRVGDRDGPDHAEVARRRDELAAAEATVRDALAALEALGVEVKDVGSGLVDFYSLHGDRLVYLCWRVGEERITAWHPLVGGFSARRPIPDVVEPGPSA